MEEDSDDFKNLLPSRKSRKIRDFETYTKHHDIVLQPLTKRGEIQNIPTPTLKKSTKAYRHFTPDFWMHVSQHIKPEDVQTFALICRQTAAVVRTKEFWNNFLKRYCNQKNQKFLAAVSHVENISVQRCDTSVLRCHVIKLLYECYKPCRKRLQVGYTLDNLIGRSYVSSWHKEHGRGWIMCYKFWNNLSKQKTNRIAPQVASWESLADEDVPVAVSTGHPFEGVFLLVIYCSSYVPFPYHLLYPNGGNVIRTHLKATREILAKNMKCFNLELDFEDNLNSSTVLVRYPTISKYRVLPWWHPDFKLHIKIPATLYQFGSSQTCSNE